MTALRRSVEHIIALYVDERLSLRAVAEKVGLSHEQVRQLLMDEGVQLRPRKQSVALAQAARRGMPQAPRPPERVASAADLERADRKHINAVARALAGRGFPFFSMGAAG